MLTIAKLFGKSPFAPLQSHMEKVSESVHLLKDIFEALKNEEFEKVLKIQKKISEKEHEADLVKNDIRNHLPRSLFMPIDRASFLEILSLQDSFADRAEDIAVILTFKQLKHFNEIIGFETFLAKTLKAFDLAKDVIKEFDNLLETSFGGMEARKVKEMIESLAYMEHELDVLGCSMVKHLYTLSDKLSYSTFHLWDTIIKELGDISNIAEKLGNRIRMILELK